jgi:hypothetical protein
MELLMSTFSIVWNSFSVPADDYNSRDEAGEFDKNIERLRQELALVSEVGASSEIPNAGFRA